MTTVSNTSLLQVYKDVNSNFFPRFVYHLGGESGFFSEYNNMILAMLYCLDKNIKFSIYSKDANFKYKEGWNDYFLPFCEEAGNMMHSFFNRRTNPRFKNHLLRDVDLVLTDFFRKVNPNVLTTFDLWDEIRSMDISASYTFQQLNLNGKLREICNALIKMTWKYNQQTAYEIEQYRQSVRLSQQYIGFHIRGGDKFIEADIQSCRKYIEKAEQLSDIRSAFVLTDDYTVIEDLVKNYQTWSFCTFCKEEERGYFHNSFKHETPELKRERYIKLFASVDVLADSKLFIGTFSSNPGMYLGMRMQPDKAFSIDLPDWKIW